jgi:hypothetical protein
VRPQGQRSLAEVRLPAPLAKLTVNRLVTIKSQGNVLRCYLTPVALQAVKNWMQSKPPNFRLMFPNLYRQLAREDVNTGGPTAPTTR